jgi:signal transduction histidine kinase
LSWGDYEGMAHALRRRPPFGPTRFLLSYELAPASQPYGPHVTTRASERLLSWARPHADVLGALAFSLACLAVLLLQHPSEGTGVTRDVDAFAVVLLVLSTLPLALRRAFPVTVAVIVIPLSIAGSLRGYALNLTALGALFSLASAAYLTDRLRSVALGAFAIVALLVGSVVTGGPLLSLQLLVSNLAPPVLAVFVGDAMRGRRELATRERERAREIEALRDADQRRAVAQERVRLAREVHDVVGHRLAAITVQARAGSRRLEADPPRAGEALAEIDDLATAALAETRSVLGQIGDADEQAPTHPVGSP